MKPKPGSKETMVGQSVIEENADIFKTFIVRFIGNQEYSFYNVETPEDGIQQLDNYFGKMEDGDPRDRAYSLSSG